MFKKYPMSGVMIAMWTIALAIIIPVLRLSGGPGTLSDDRVWYYDLGSSELVVGHVDWIPPVPAPSRALIEGEQALVRAMFYACGSCTTNEPTLLYLQKYSPEAREKLASVNGDALKLTIADRMTVENGRLVRRPNDRTWYSASSDEGRSILNAHRTLCPPGPDRSRVCNPNPEAGPIIRLPSPALPAPEEAEENS